MKRLAIAAVVLALAGCGGAAQRAKPTEPRLPTDLAQSWAQQSDAVATALASGDACTARRLAGSLRTQFISAVNAHRVPPRLQEPLGAALNDLQSRIACTPPQPAGDQKKNKRDRGKGDGKGDD